MKRILVFTVMILSLGFANIAVSQTGVSSGTGGTIEGGLGMAVIDGDPFFEINFRPDISLGKFGVGLNINLLYNTETGHIRSEDWDEGYDWARLIRYLRYGHKRDKFYARVGALDAARLGHGFIMNYYTNEASYDERKIGLVFDLDLGLGGFEFGVNNLGRLEVVGLRGYVRPLQQYIDVPIVKDLTFGATVVADVDPDGIRDTDDGLYEFGWDIELPLIRTSMLTSFVYYDWAKIDSFGSGQAVGIEANLTLVAGVAEMSAKLERRWLGERFLPSYFNAFYEVERYMPTSDSTFFRKDLDMLNNVTEETKGIFGELGGHILNVIRLVGNFQRLDDVKYSGILHLGASVPDAVPKIVAHATYDRRGIESGSDLFKLDENSIARVGIGYKIKPYLLLNLDYIYTFHYDEEKEEYKAQERFEPRVSFVYNF